MREKTPFSKVLRSKEVLTQTVQVCRVCGKPAHFNGVTYSDCCHRLKCQDKWMKLNDTKI